MAGVLRAGQFELQEAEIVSASGTIVDLTKSILSLTLFEDINRFTMSGLVVVQDSVNLASMLPLVGQEQFVLKLATASLTEGEFIIDFSKNAFSVNKVSGRLDIGSGVQAYNISFVSRELMVDQRTKVVKSLVGTPSDLVTKIYQNDLGTKKKIFVEPSSGIRKIVSPNQRPFELIKELMGDASSKDFFDPYYFNFETPRGFNFRSLASMYAQPSKIEYRQFVTGTKTNKGAVNVEADFSHIMEYNILSTQDALQANRFGTYGSVLYTHDVVSKTFQKHTYNYLDSFSKERHIESTNAKFNGEDVEDYPIVSSSEITDARDRISDFPARTFVQPVNGTGTDHNHQNEFGQEDYSSNDPVNKVQKRNSQIEQFKRGYTVQLKVHGATFISAGDIVDINLPYTASTKTEKNEDFDKIYRGKFLVSKIRHDFTLQTKSHTMLMEGIKDSLTFELPAAYNPELVDDTESEVEDDLYTTLV